MQRQIISYLICSWDWERLFEQETFYRLVQQ